MATGKKFYWIKLWESFMKGKEVDYLMDKPDGSKYVMLFLFLCVNAINTNGRLEEQIGKIIRPFTLAKLTRDLKFFSEDTIMVGLKLLQDTELISMDPNGTIVINNFGSLVGSETDWKIQKRIQRERKNLPDSYGQTADNTVDMSIQRTRGTEDKNTTTTSRSGSGCCDDGSDFNDVLSAAVDAGFPEIPGTIKALRKLMKKHGKTDMLYGIEACLRQNKNTIAYLEGCLNNRTVATDTGLEMPGHVWM